MLAQPWRDHLCLAWLGTRLTYSQALNFAEGLPCLMQSIVKLQHVHTAAERLAAAAAAGAGAGAAYMLRFCKFCSNP